MTQEKLEQAQSLLKQIKIIKDKLETFPKFLNKPLVTDVKLVASQNRELFYILDREDLENMVIYLQMKYESKLESLQERFDEL